MRKSRHSETEIVKAVNQLDSGLSADVLNIPNRNVLHKTVM